MQPTTKTALLALAILTACGESATSPESTDLFSDAAAALAADAALEDLVAMDAALIGPLAAPPFASGTFERERTVTFFDAAGAEQDGYDPLETESINFVSSLEGEVTRENFSAAVERSRDLWVTGLAGDEETRTWNGEGASHWERARLDDEGEEHSYVADASLLIEDVVRSIDRQAHPWPLSGTITRELTITIENGPNGDETRERIVVVTFDGTQIATVSVDGEPAHELDLATREGRNPLRRRLHGRNGR